MNINKEQAKQILQQLTPKELEIYRKLNKELSGVNEENIQLLIKGIASNWKKFSGAMLMALMMNSNVANAINKYSPETYNSIKTEISKQDGRRKFVLPAKLGFSWLKDCSEALSTTMRKSAP